MSIKYELLRDKDIDGAWRVEALNELTDEINIALFGGPRAESNAIEYLGFKKGKLPKVASPAPAAAPDPTRHILGAEQEFEIKTKRGQRVWIQPSRMTWEYNERKDVVTGRTRSPIRKEGE